MKLTFAHKMKSLLYVSLSGFGAYSIIGVYKNDENFYRNIVMPLVHMIDAESAHRLGVVMSKYNLLPKSSFVNPESLKIRVFGKDFNNPIGIAAGFDKNGEAIVGLRDMGFGFVEVGSVTPEPQDGNEKPRVFRLKEDLAVINRYGFNSEGHTKVLERLNHIKQNKIDGIVGVNLGKNKTSLDPINDYVIGIEKFGPIADYLVVNISSPNTPGLRNMQNKNTLRELLIAVIAARNKLPENRRPPILLKLAPDLNTAERNDIAEVIQLNQCRVDGLIVSNTTIERPKYLLNTNNSNEDGGLSGKPLRDSTTSMISEMYKLTKGQIPIIGVGGIFSGKDAYDKIKAGASIVQIYTSLVYEGPPVVTKIKRELGQLLKEDGYRNVAEAVGKNSMN